MFEKLIKKLTKEEPKEEMEFKPFEPSTKTESRAPVYEEPVYTHESNDIENRAGGVELKVIRPESFDEVSTVADNLVAGVTVVLNVEVLDRTTTHRMLDFLNGVTYCTDGTIKRVAPTTFIITPHSNIDISDM